MSFPLLSGLHCTYAQLTAAMPVLPQLSTHCAGSVQVQAGPASTPASSFSTGPPSDPGHGVDASCPSGGPEQAARNARTPQARLSAPRHRPVDGDTSTTAPAHTPCEGTLVAPPPGTGNALTARNCVVMSSMSQSLGGKESGAGGCMCVSVSTSAGTTGIPLLTTT